MYSFHIHSTFCDGKNTPEEIVRTALEKGFLSIGLYIKIAAESNCIFEINTGAIARGLRTTPYPAENLLHVLKIMDVPIMLSADSHSAETIDFGFDEMKRYLYQIGFRHAYAYIDHELKKYSL